MTNRTLMKPDDPAITRSPSNPYVVWTAVGAFIFIAFAGVGYANWTNPAQVAAAVVQPVR